MYVENVEEWEAGLSQRRFFKTELEVKVIEHGIVLPSRGIKGRKNVYEGGVCDNDFNFVAGYYRQKNSGGGFNTLESSYTVDRKKIVQLDEDVIFGGLLATHFGHFLTECLCRLWYVLKNPQLNSKILFVTTLKNGGHRPYTDDFFKLMGLDTERIIYVDKPVQCRSVTVPEQAQYDWRRLTEEFLLPYQAIKARIKPGDTKKLYLTRLGFESKKHGNVHCFNEKYFEDFFAARGFKVVSMEKLKIEEQLSLINGADEIAATLGTLTHWAMFCKPGAKFIMLNRTSKYVSRIQCLINAKFDADCYVVDGSKNFLFADRTHGACMFGSNKHWKEFVADYFGEQIDEDDADSYFNNALNDYIEFWCQKYADEKARWIDSMKNMCNRIVELEKEAAREQPAFIRYKTHVGIKGWCAWKHDNQFSNAVSQQFDIQAIKIEPLKNFYEIYYSVFYNERKGWSAEVSSSQVAGTIGRIRSITGIKIRLEKAGERKFDILYRVHKFDGDWTDWAENGEELLSGGVKLNSIQIKLEPKLNRPLLCYQTHVANKGWSEWKAENSLSNPLDQKLDIQAIRITFEKPFRKIYYSVYYNNKEGWSEEISDGERAGTTGKAKPIRGIKIWLDERGTRKFDIFYRVHTFDGEWTDWAENGEEIISDGVKLNSLQIKLEPKIK